MVTSRLPLDDIWSVLRLLTPDLAVFLVSLVTMVVCGQLVKRKEVLVVTPPASASLLEVSGEHFLFGLIGE